MSKGDVVWGWEWYDALSPEVRKYVDPVERRRVEYAKKHGKVYRPRVTECADCGADISQRHAKAERCVPCSNKRHTELVRARQELYKRDKR